MIHRIEDITCNLTAAGGICQELGYCQLSILFHRLVIATFQAQQQDDDE
jgi:hypothetical protein